jgi:serine/threonine protein kinase
MSPEQTRGDKLDGRSDLFSAGIVLYQMIVGVRPFRGDSLVAVATKIANEEAPPIDRERTDVPAIAAPGGRPLPGQEPGAALPERCRTGRCAGQGAGRDRRGSAGENRPRIVPLRVKWAAMMALIVAVVMGMTATVITQRQYGAMMARSATTARRPHASSPRRTPRGAGRGVGSGRGGGREDDEDR